jgi:hypothetical protein
VNEIWQLRRTTEFGSFLFKLPLLVRPALQAWASLSSLSFSVPLCRNPFAAVTIPKNFLCFLWHFFSLFAGALTHFSVEQLKARYRLDCVYHIVCLSIRSHQKQTSSDDGSLRH